MSNRTGRNPHVIYRGHRYYRKTGRKYYQRTWPSRALLHIQKWTDKYGPRPSGAVIHHKDGDPENNRLSNLELMTRSDHARLHGRQNGQACAERLAKGRLKAEAWRKSNVGRSKLRILARQRWMSMPMMPMVCAECGVSYEAKNPRRRYCGVKCVTRHQNRTHRARKKADSG